MSMGSWRMKNRGTTIPAWLILMTLCAAAVTGSSPAGATRKEAVVLAVGDDFQGIVDRHPAGTTYRIAAGVHRLQTVHPKSGDTFIGEYGAVLKGSKVLDPPEAKQQGDLYYWDGQDQRAAGPFEWGAAAQKGHEREVHYGNELFIDGERYRHVNEFEDMNERGTWYFDYDANRIYIFGDPSGRQIETSVTRYAFNLDGLEDVTIANLYIHHYANPARPQGVIRARNADRTTVRHVELSYNHAAGLGLGRNILVEHCRFAYNGQIGVVGNGQHTPMTFRNNEVTGNMALGWEAGWEGGATKFAFSKGGLYENNWVHHNNGFGFWWDIRNKGDVIRSNLVEGGPQRRGIFYEISGHPDHPTEIYWNIVRGVGESGINISNSTNVRIYENAVSASRFGVAASENRREPQLNQLQIHDNDIQTHGAAQIRVYGPEGEGHRVQRIDGNVFRGIDNFQWLGNQERSFEQWQSELGHDANSRMLEGNREEPRLPDHATPFSFSVYGPVRDNVEAEKKR